VNLELSYQEQEQQKNRRIIHIDMDAFFASVEQRDHPELIGKPVIVGGSPDSRGVVAACSYEARKFGVHSAMPSSQAARLCPNAHYIRPNIAKYRQVSQHIHRIFRQYTDCIEPLSLDEAYLDVSGKSEAATHIAHKIKSQIHQELNLVASAGVSFNKFLAKLASDMDKPNGLFVIRPGDAQTIIDSLAVRKFHGIGPVTDKKMSNLGVFTGKDLRDLEFDVLLKHFKSSAKYYYQIARGIDTRRVQTGRKRKSIGAETTYANDISDEKEIELKLFDIAKKVAETLAKKELSAKTLTLKIKFSNFRQITRSYTSKTSINFSSDSALVSVIKLLVSRAELNGNSVRLLGVSCSKLSGMENDASYTEYKQTVLDFME